MSISCLSFLENQPNRHFMKLMTLLVVSVIGTFTVNPAQAQNGWGTPTYKVTGSRQVWKSQGNPVVWDWYTDQSWAGTLYPPSVQWGSNWAWANNSSGCQTKIQVQIETTFPWQGTYPPTTPPTVALIKVNSNADAYSGATNTVDNGSDDLTPKITQFGGLTQDGSYLVSAPVSNNNAVFIKTLSASDIGPSGYGISLSYNAAPFNASVRGDSTANTAGWDSTHPRFFSGTNCKASGTALAVSGYVAHAQLLINGTIVHEYWNQSSAPSTLPDYGFKGSNLSSVSLGAFFDSTHFSDGNQIQIQMKVWDTANNTYNGVVSANAYNKAYLLAPADWRFPLTRPILDTVQNLVAESNYSGLRTSADDKTAVLNNIPYYTLLYSSCHANQNGFCDPTQAEPNLPVTPYAGRPDSVEAAVTKKNQLNTPPYNLVFIDGCNSAGGYDSHGIFSKGTGGNGFGIYGLDQAFLGWPSETTGQVNSDFIYALWRSLRNGNTLCDAVQDGINGGQPYGPSSVPDMWNPNTWVEISPQIIGDPATKLHGLYGGGGLSNPYQPALDTIWSRAITEH